MLEIDGIKRVQMSSHERFDKCLLSDPLVHLIRKDWRSQTNKDSNSYACIYAEQDML